MAGAAAEGRRARLAAALLDAGLPHRCAWRAGHGLGEDAAMAMTQRLWSINALATELSMDRRTVAKKLSGVRPSGTLNGNPAWHLTVALDAIRGRRRHKR